MAFQFQYGTIKRKKSLINKQELFCFNSNMVQLRGNYQNNDTSSSEFQFQYGTIKSP